MTTARWYGGHAAVPSERIFSSRNSISRVGLRTALVSWKRNDLLAEPPPLAMKRNLYSGTSLAGRRVELDLGRQVGAGVLLLERRERRELGVAEVEPGVGVVHALADRLAVVAAGEHALGLLAHHDRRAGVLAHRQHAACGDVDVLEQVERDEAVVARGVGVVDDPAQLGEVAGPQVVADVVHRLVGEPPDRLRVDLQEGLSVDLEGGHALGGDEPVGGLLGAVGAGGREQVGVVELSGAHEC